MVPNLRGLIDRLVGICLSLLVAAIALSVAVTLVRPYLTLLAMGGGVFVVLAARRRWQRNRW